MSASPSNVPSGRTPNGGGPPMIRRPRIADPLVRPKKRDRTMRRPPSGAVGGNRPPSQPPQQPGTNAASAGTPQSTPGPRSLAMGTGIADSGFSAVPDGPYTDYPLVTTKRALLEGLRYHVAKFSSKKFVDPRNEAEFTRPVRLHRRDPRAPPAGPGAAKTEDVSMTDVDSKEALMDDKEREKQEALRAEKEAEREANLAQIAPAAHTNQPKKPNAFKKKTQQVFRNDKSEEGQAQSKLRYEEALPWHLEDFDNKNTWVGNYESALSESYAILVMEPTAVFRMIPIEKWYKFTAKAQFKTLTIEEAEDRMRQKVKEPRWFMDSQRQTAESQKAAQDRRAYNKLYVGKSNNEDTGVGPIKAEGGGDADDLDFTEDRFADDEENQLFEGDEEENKEAEDRIKRDQLQANIFDLKDQKEYEKAEAAEKKEKELLKKFGKTTRKTLTRREKNFIYADDDSDHPYSEESESEDSETERLKDEERKKEEEKKAVEKGKREESGTSSKGTTTPSGRDKHFDATKKSSTLKRSGSPNLSEASGTESTRKKHKKKHGPSSQPTASAPGSRPMSPAPSEPGRPLQQRKSTGIKLIFKAPKLTNVSSTAPRQPTRAGSGSEAEATAGETSDAGKKTKIKLRLGGSPVGGTPQGSRAASPEAGQAGAIGSRSGSPDGPKLAAATADEIIASIPNEGTTIAALLARFKGRVGDRQRFISLVRAHSRFGPDKLLRPRGTA
ncbi:Rap30/74 interaction domain-containing protein [Xylona heveae TC161]|uniref:Transcription initiation factor IIF subunit alpha n=1 Tax=Xylona heveae (strain CBS 132557 / TC161) TaxID=1328760 RepID=A0A165FNH4_XYLHT|nr:Rap30/74 interaction domain-containing protein [Xylona heveae TC161]KZF21191.1 Rap30/74 interaction domain-containing protein [Xylona heveae TC161]